MNPTKLTVKITTKIIILAIISMIVCTLNSPIISNELAMTQMQNSNELYLMVETYNKVKPIISVIYGCIATLLVGTSICDTYKFISTQNKGEN